MSDFTNAALSLYKQFYDKLNILYLSHLEECGLDTNLTIDLPVPSEKELRKTCQITQIEDTKILRINIESPVVALRSKHLYNHETGESSISLIDISVEKIWLRMGGFGSRIINLVFDLQRTQLLDHLNVTDTKTKMIIFRYLSLPFWIKTGFEFRWMLPESVCHKHNHQNTIYKFFKLLIMMNQSQDLGQYVPEYEIFSMDMAQINEVIIKWIVGYYRKTYNDHLQIKNRIIDHIDIKCCDEYRTQNIDFCTKIIYKNVCNLLSNDKLCELGIMQILWELFYMEKFVG